MSDEFSAYKDANRLMWNIWTGEHEKSEFYNVAGFKAGRLSLRKIEMDELAPHVSGKTLLNPMCHFGLDTLSWARLGAEVSGADLSDEAIALAQRLSQETNVPARFIASDIYRLPEALPGETFDIVYSSYGILHWLPDLARWAEIIAGFVKPGGFFYIVEDHPFMRVFSSTEDGGVAADNPYFYQPDPFEMESKGTYATNPDDPNAPVTRGYMWDHPLSEVINSLIAAGLRIEYLHEFDFAVRAKFKGMRQEADGLFRFPEPLRSSIPILFSLKASKD